MAHMIELSKPEEFITRVKIDRLFWKEVNICLVSPCACLNLEFDKNFPWKNVSYEPRHEKTCLRDLRPGKTQTGMRSHRS